MTDLILHMETTHTAELLRMFGIQNMEQYKDSFDVSSEEQLSLRTEKYCKTKCINCAETFSSVEKMTLHMEMDICKTLKLNSRMKRRSKNDIVSSESINLSKKIKTEHLNESDDIDKNNSEKKLI